MKICDRCAPELVPSTETINLEVEGQKIHLCEKCKNETLQFIHEQTKPKRGILGLGKRKESARAVN